MNWCCSHLTSPKDDGPCPVEGLPPVQRFVVRIVGVPPEDYDSHQHARPYRHQQGPRDPPNSQLLHPLGIRIRGHLQGRQDCKVSCWASRSF